MRARRPVLIGGLAAGAGALAVLASSAFEPVRRSLRTSSSPGARFYDLFAGIVLGGYYDDVAGDCAATLADVDAPTILEVGPGPGHLPERLLSLLPAARWTGLDVDPAMLQACERRLDAVGLGGRGAVVEADVASMPLPDGAFDLVVSSLSAHHWPDADAGFREIRRVLRPGGRALAYDLPVRWGHLETGGTGLRTADERPEAPTWSRFRGVGPWTLIWRVEIRA